MSVSVLTRKTLYGCSGCHCDSLQARKCLLRSMLQKLQKVRASSENQQQERRILIFLLVKSKNNKKMDCHQLHLHLHLPPSPPFILSLLQWAFNLWANKLNISSVNAGQDRAKPSQPGRLLLLIWRTNCCSGHTAGCSLQTVQICQQLGALIITSTHQHRQQHQRQHQQHQQQHQQKHLG